MSFVSSLLRFRSFRSRDLAWCRIVVHAIRSHRLSKQIKIACIDTFCKLPQRSQILLFAHR